MGRTLAVANRRTGEIVEQPELEGYDWSRSKRHTNTNKSLGKEIWDKDSGLNRNDRDVLGFYIFNSPPGGGPVRQSFAEIADRLEMKRVTVGRCVGRLETAKLLIVAEKVGRVKFFRLNARFNFDGKSTQQRAAVRGVPHPVIPLPEEEAM
ncbi:MarR family transcriptional regulator [Streptomyces sp. NPDC059533]|uniref:MarR family transcriptional regulator n=1 Tax=unclassified Streptomyces TaxID=2593676 RepID=UPI0036AE106A